MYNLTVTLSGGSALDGYTLLPACTEYYGIDARTMWKLVSEYSRYARRDGRNITFGNQPFCTGR